MSAARCGASSAVRVLSAPPGRRDPPAVGDGLQGPSGEVECRPDGRPYLHHGLLQVGIRVGGIPALQNDMQPAQRMAEIQRHRLPGTSTALRPKQIRTGIPLAPLIDRQRMLIPGRGETRLMQSPGRSEVPGGELHLLADLRPVDLRLPGAVRQTERIPPFDPRGQIPRMDHDRIPRFETPAPRSIHRGPGGRIPQHHLPHDPIVRTPHGLLRRIFSTRMQNQRPQRHA